MRVIRRNFFNAASMRMRLYPLGDVHTGAKACDEDALAQAVKEIAADPYAYWVGMGDYIEAIKRNDRRFDPTTLADWVTNEHLVDLARAQVDRFLGIVQPIAHKCLGLLLGNHEEAVIAQYEHDIYGELIRDLKRMAGFDADYPLRLGYTGYLQMSFYRGDDTTAGSRLLTGNFHHGAGGGAKGSGSSVNNLEQWLARHTCDFCVVGHSHKTATTKIAVEEVCPRSGRIVYHYRHGVVSSTFLRSYQEDHDGTYGEKKMYWPLATGRTLLELWPHAPEGEPRVKVSSW